MTPTKPQSSSTPSRRLLLLSGLALLGVVGAASVCSAEGPWLRRAPPPPYGFSLEDANGTPLPSFRHEGRVFVLGEPGARYAIRLRNPTPERVEAVVTIDGRDAVSGEVGDYVTERGYLLEPWGSVVVEGFRRSLDEVAAFRFSDRGESYSALRGTPQNVGVVGVAFFPEKVTRAPVLRRAERNPPRDDPRPATREHEGRAAKPSKRARSDDGEGASRGAGPPAESSRGKAGYGKAEAPYREELHASEQHEERKAPNRGRPSNIGTQYAESHASSVVEVPFARRSPTHPALVITLRYDDFAGLEARGIDLSSLGYLYGYAEEPQAFPRRRFAPPP